MFNSKLLQFIASVRFTAPLLLLIALASIPGTFLKSSSGYYSSPIFISLLLLLVFSTVLCTAGRIRAIRISSILVHGGIVIAAAGGIIRYANGYVSTVNMYENTTINSVYRWDIQKDQDLPFYISLNSVGSEYYPPQVKVGVLENNQKKELVTASVGSSFRAGEYDVRIEKLFQDPDSLLLKLFKNGSEIKVINTAGTETESPDIPYSFRLVAYKNPQIKRSWVELSIKDESGVMINGRSEVNSPFDYNSFSIHHVQNAFDESGRIYAGLQIVKDPGRNTVFAGCVLISAGVLLIPFRRKKNGDR